MIGLLMTAQNPALAYPAIHELGVLDFGFRVFFDFDLRWKSSIFEKVTHHAHSRQKGTHGAGLSLQTSGIMCPFLKKRQTSPH
jgi:hypothetical protein